MNKIAAKCMAAVLSLLLLACPAQAAQSESVPASQSGISWYCPPVRDGRRCLDGEMQFIEQKPVLWHQLPAEGDRVLYLTFDAGYENGNVEKILDVLAEKQAPGAFFVLEHFVTANPELVQRMANEGHLVCNHTAKHHDMSKISDPNAFSAELCALESACESACGVSVAKFYRPPEGRFSEANLDAAAAMGYTTVLWSMAYADWDNDRQPDPAAAKKKLLNGTQNGDIVLLHPTSATNAAILGDLIDAWRAEGYRFGSLEELAEVNKNA